MSLAFYKTHAGNITCY